MKWVYFLNRDDVSVMMDQRMTYHRILPSRIYGQGPLRFPSRARFISRTHGDFSRWVRIWSDHGDERYSYAIPFKGSGVLGYSHFLKRLWKTLRSCHGWRNSAKINSPTYCYYAESDAGILLAPLGSEYVTWITKMIQQCVKDYNIFRVGTIWCSIIW